MTLTLSVGVNFEDQAVTVNILEVNAVEVAWLEIWVENKQLALVYMDLFWELGYECWLIEQLFIFVKN